MTSAKSTQKRVVKFLSPGWCTTFSVIFVGLAIWAITCKGAYVCLDQCTDFYSDVCTATRIGFPIYWTYNGILISKENEEFFNVKLSPLGYDDDGRWMLNITVYNVCISVNISCRQGEQILLSCTIRICENSESGLDSRNWTTSTTSDPQPLVDESYMYIAAAVLVPIFVVIAVTVGVLLLIWCMRQRGCLRLPANIPGIREGRGRTHTAPASDSSDNLKDTSTSEGVNNETKSNEAVPPTETSSGDMARISRDSMRERRKLTASRDDANIELIVVEANPLGEPVIKPQVDNVDLSPNHSLPDIFEKRSGQQCSDKHGLQPMFCFDGEVSSTGNPSPEKKTYVIPENIPQEENSVA